MNKIHNIEIKTGELLYCSNSAARDIDHLRSKESTLVRGAEMTPSFSLGVPITNAQYLCVVASQALFQIYMTNRNKIHMSC